MYFDERRTHFLEDRLSRRLKECRIDSFYNYYRLLLSDQGKGELSRLVEDLTDGNGPEQLNDLDKYRVQGFDLGFGAARALYGTSTSTISGH